MLGNIGEGRSEHLSDYQAPENPLQIGGQIYLRTQSTALQGDYPDRWTLSAPSLLDAYFDARPNPRVRAFILGRMSYNPTAAPRRRRDDRQRPPGREPGRVRGRLAHRLHDLQRGARADVDARSDVDPLRHRASACS